MYKVKRFSSDWKFNMGGLGTLAGASIAHKLSKGNGRVTAIGAGLGLAGGLYLGHKIDKATDKWNARQAASEEKKREEKAARDKRYQYPTKELESEYPAIVELGGMPKEYYQMAEICKKVYTLDSYPSWGDGDEYQTPRVAYLDEVEEVILGKNKYWDKNINKYPLIWIGVQGYGLLTYDFNKHQWFDIAYKTPKRVTNLKSHIIKIYEDDMKNYGYDDKGAFLDEDYIQEVIEYYTDIIKILKSSKLG